MESFQFWIGCSKIKLDWSSCGVFYAVLIPCLYLRLNPLKFYVYYIKTILHLIAEPHTIYIIKCLTLIDWDWKEMKYR